MVSSTTVSCCPFRISDRMINRTTCPATLIVAWLVNGYIEYVFDISNFVTLLVAVRSHFGLRLGGRINPDRASNRILGRRINSIKPPICSKSELVGSQGRKLKKYVIVLLEATAAERAACDGAKTTHIACCNYSEVRSASNS
jgi:hypothetical protein